MISTLECVEAWTSRKWKCYAGEASEGKKIPGGGLTDWSVRQVHGFVVDDNENLCYLQWVVKVDGLGLIGCDLL